MLPVWEFRLQKVSIVVKNDSEKYFILKMNTDELLDQWVNTRRLEVEFDAHLKLTIVGYLVQLEGSPLPTIIPGWPITVESSTRIRLGPPEFPSVSSIEYLLNTLYPVSSVTFRENEAYIVVPKILAPSVDEIKPLGWVQGRVENIDSFLVKITLATFAPDIQVTQQNLRNFVDRRYGLKPYLPASAIADYKVDSLPTPINTRGKSGGPKRVERRIRSDVVRAPRLRGPVQIRKRKLAVREDLAPGIYLNFMSPGVNFLISPMSVCGCYTERDVLGRQCRCQEPNLLTSVRKCGCFG